MRFASSQRGRRAMVFLLSVLEYRSLLWVTAFQLAPVTTCGSQLLLGRHVKFAATAATTTTALWSRSSYLENLSRPPGNETSAAHKGYKGYNDVEDDTKFGGSSGLRQLYPEFAKTIRELGAEEKEGTVESSQYDKVNVQRTSQHLKTKEDMHRTEIGEVKGLQNLQHQHQQDEQLPSDRQDELKRQLAAKDSKADHHQAAQLEEIQTLHTKLETMANHKLTTHSQHVQEIEKLALQVANLQVALQEQQKGTKRKDQTAQENGARRTELEAERSQLQKDYAKAVQSREDAYAREKSTHAKDQEVAASQLQQMQKQADATEQGKMQLQLDFQRELAAKDTSYQNRMEELQEEKANEIQDLQSRLEKTAKEFQEYKFTAQRQQMAANDLTAQKEMTLSRKLVSLDMALQKQAEVTKMEREQIQESLEKRTKLEAELSQLRIDSRKAVQDWKEAYTREQSARSQDKDAASRKLHALQEQATAAAAATATATVNEKMQQAKESIYRTKIADLRASTAKEIQAMQSRLETTTSKWRIYNLATERQQKVAGQTADEKEEVLMRSILDLQSALQEQKEESKQKDKKVQENWLKRLVLMSELSQLQTDSEKAIQSREDAFAREKSIRANDQAASVSQLEEIQKEANTTEQEKMRLQLDFQRALVTKDLFYRTKIDDLKAATSKEMQTLQSKLEATAKQATDERKEALMRQLSDLQIALQEQKESTKREGVFTAGNLTGDVKLEAKLLQPINDRGNATRSWEDVLELEQKIRAHANDTIEENLQLQLQLYVQHELAAKDTSYLKIIVELQEEKAKEIQDLQSRLENTAKELEEFNLKTHRQLTVLNETGSQEQILFLQQTASLHAALREQKEATKAKRLEVQEHQEKRMHLEAELSQLRNISKKGEDDWTEKYAREQSARAQDKDTASKKLRAMQEQASATEQNNVQLQLDFNRELEAKDSIYATKIDDLKAGTVEDIQALQSKLETTASETDRQQKAALHTVDKKEKALLQQITTLQTALEEQEEAAKQEGVKAQETSEECVELVAKLSQLQEEYRNATKSWKNTLEDEHEIRFRDHDTTATQLQAMQEQVNATLQEKMQLDLDFQSELAAKDSFYRIKIDELQEEKGMEIQALQRKLDRTTKEGQEDKSKKDRELETLRVAASQEKEKFSQQIAELQTALQEQTETVKREELKEKENWNKRMQLKDELLQVQTNYAKAVKDLEHVLEEGRQAPDKNLATAAQQLQTLQEQADTQEEEKLQLQAKLKQESESKDASCRTNIAKLREIESLQKKIEKMANYWQTFKTATNQELVSGREASEREISSLTQQLSKLQADLHEQRAAKPGGSMVGDTKAKVLALEAELLQLQKDSEKDAKDREDAYKCESVARARDHASGIERLKTMGEQNVEQATAEKMQLQRKLQNELAEQDTMYQTKIAEIDANNTREVQALQARLEKVINEYQDYKVTMDARHKELVDIQSANEHYDALVQENQTLQTTLNEQSEATKRQDLKAQDFMKLFESLEEELPRSLKDSEQTVEETQADYKLGREGRATDKSSAATTLKELQGKARQYIVSLEEQGRDKTERVRNELTNLVAEKKALISQQQAIIDEKEQQIIHDRNSFLARLRETEGITDNLRIRLAAKGIEMRNTEAMLARQNELIAEMSAERGSVKVLPQQASELFKAATQVGFLARRVTSRVKNEKKYHTMPQTARDGNDGVDDNEDLSGREDENAAADDDDDDGEFDSDFANWHDDPEGLVSAWSTALSTAKNLTHPAWRRLQNLISHASSGSARHLWKQPPYTFSAVQRDRLPPSPEDVTPKERRKTSPRAHGMRSIRTSFGMVKVYNREASPPTHMETVTYPRAHGTRSIRTSFGAVEVYNSAASPTPPTEKVTHHRAHGTRYIQTSFGPVKVYNSVASPTTPTEEVFSDGNLQRQMTRT